MLSSVFIDSSISARSGNDLNVKIDSASLE